MEIVIVSPESRRRDNLISMLESFIPSSAIKMVEVCCDVVKISNPSDPAIVFIDYREPELFNKKDISCLILNNAINYVVLLISRNSPKASFTHYSSCELIYDEISIDMLQNLLLNVQRKSK